ncbi:MAG: 2-oxo acid dehydrogenase subunit E2 [Actinobacteria bacterium]|nr:2-oxo acid dehydrogenase subunit E2 [Actinomycetota bacterium]MCA1720818.1 2-oxo acid dehydrogenase subunit E2 [Actinomycetota bacterium]
MTAPARRPSVRRKIAVATWRPSREGRLYARMAVDASPTLAYCAARRAETGVPVTPAAVVGMAFQRGVMQVPEFHNRVVFGRIVPFPSYDVAFAVDIEGGDDLAPTKVRGADTKTVVEVAAELARGAERLRARQDRDFQTTNGIARRVPWFLLRPLLAAASLLNGGIGVRAFGQPAHPLGSLFVTNIGSFGLDEGYVAPVPLARVPLYVCVGAVADAPMAVDGEVVVRPRIVITATADHRLVDGAHAAALARLVRGYLAAPDTLDAQQE